MSLPSEVAVTPLKTSKYCPLVQLTLSIPKMLMWSALVPTGIELVSSSPKSSVIVGSIGPGVSPPAPLLVYL